MIKPIHGMQTDADAMYFLQWFTSIQDEKRDEQVFEAQQDAIYKEKSMCHYLRQLPAILSRKTAML